MTANDWMDDEDLTPEQLQSRAELLAELRRVFPAKRTGFAGNTTSF